MVRPPLSTTPYKLAAPTGRVGESECRSGESLRHALRAPMFIGAYFIDIVIAVHRAFASGGVRGPGIAALRSIRVVCIEYTNYERHHISHYFILSVYRRGTANQAHR